MASLIKYTPAFKQEVLEIFDSNVPEFFEPFEREPFEDFLSKELNSYFILSQSDETIGAGGYWKETESEARICWLMIHADYHTKGFGAFMMNSFEELIKTEKNYTKITLKTAQKTDMFYEKLGYTTTYFEKDHWAKGLHLYLMEKSISS